MSTRIHRRTWVAALALAFIVGLATTGCTTESAGSGGSTENTINVPDASSFKNLRQLSGTINVATQASLPVPGAPLTRTQQAWQAVIDAYKKLEPNVTIQVIDQPADASNEKYCASKRAAKQLPDLVMLKDCDYFRPSADEITAGTAIATDFKPFEMEPNPYTDQPWKNDWLSDSVRLGRCQENGAVDQWTCQTNWLEVKSILVNWDILKEFGVTTFPTSLGELWDLSKKINDSKKYTAWDNSPYRYGNFRNDLASMLAMDVFQNIGGDPSNLKIQPFAFLPDQAKAYCTQTAWIQKNPSLQEVMKQSQQFIDANGGGELFFDPTRESGKQWLQGKAAFWWGSSENQPEIDQAKADGTFQVSNWDLQWLPDVTSNDLIDKNTQISFDGKFYVDYGGQGDVFAPIASVRASGADENVDLIVRDFLQFMSSKYGQQRQLIQGLLPVNADTIQQAPQTWRVAVEKYVPVTTDVYQGATQPPGGFFQAIQNFDPASSDQAWFRGDLTFDKFMKQSDDNVTKETVSQLKDNLAQWGLKELPAECKNVG